MPDFGCDLKTKVTTRAPRITAQHAAVFFFVLSVAGLALLMVPALRAGAMTCEHTRQFPPAAWDCIATTFTPVEARAIELQGVVCTDAQAADALRNIQFHDAARELCRPVFEIFA